ncbi:unnamed protein product [Ambrosiozyma monospora]|uniref:Unnamed protein product n=1 Tax=Ambrosiozyma monospora TaxID=43982 RepID=A0ACB5T9Q1_AMBMO|nr:unnamed protein product [Ambrosiozyma monospora]
MIKLGFPISRRLFSTGSPPILTTRLAQALKTPSVFSQFKTIKYNQYNQNYQRVNTISTRSLWTSNDTKHTTSKFNLTQLKSAFVVKTSKRFATHNSLSHRLRQQRRNSSKLAFLYPTAFACGVTLLCFSTFPWLFDHTPLRYFKRNPTALLYTIIGANVLVWGLWQIQTSNATLFRVLNGYFLHDLTHFNVTSARSYAQMILAGWSHVDPMHLLFNMMCFYSFGTTMVQTLGPANFMSLYVGAGAFSSLFSMLLARVGATSLGASGSISGVFAMFATLFPKAGVGLFFIPIPESVIWIVLAI